MGTVFKARQPVLDRIVALKVIAPRVAQDAAYIARFQHEAKAAARLNHPNVVAVYSAGEDQGVHFLVQEFVEGESLQERLARKGRLDPQEALAVCIFVAEGLKHAWEEARIIHRDIKPANIFISSKGAVKVGDLGLAKSVAPEASAGLTQPGAAVGTPHYCSPEQAQAAKELDFRADIYGLGCTLYHMLSGKKPYEDGPEQSPMSILIKQATAPPPAILQVLPSCPKPVVTLLARMLAKQPSARHESYDELIGDLHRVHEMLRQAKGSTAISSSFHATASKKKLAPALIYSAMAAATVVVVAGLLWWWAPWKQRGAPGVAPENTSRLFTEAPKNEPQPLRPADAQEPVAVAPAKPSAAAAVTSPAAGWHPAPPAAAKPAPPGDVARIRLAVLDLVTGAGLDAEDGKTLADFMRNAIVNSGRFEVLERQNIKRVFEEQHFSQAFADTGQSLVQAGKLLDANRVLGGRLARFSTIWTLTLTLVDVNTGKVIGSLAVTHDGEMKGLLESAQRAAMELVSKDPVAAAEERKTRIAQWQKQIAELRAALAGLDGEEKKELDQIQGSLAGILANLRTELYRRA